MGPVVLVASPPCLALWESRVTSGEKWLTPNFPVENNKNKAKTILKDFVNILNCGLWWSKPARELLTGWLRNRLKWALLRPKWDCQEYCLCRRLGFFHSLWILNKAKTSTGKWGIIYNVFSTLFRFLSIGRCLLFPSENNKSIQAGRTSGSNRSSSSAAKLISKKKCPCRMSTYWENCFTFISQLFCFFPKLSSWSVYLI